MFKFFCGVLMVSGLLMLSTLSFVYEPGLVLAGVVLMTFGTGFQFVAYQSDEESMASQVRRLTYSTDAEIAAFRRELLEYRSTKSEIEELRKDLSRVAQMAAEVKAQVMPFTGGI